MLPYFNLSEPKTIQAALNCLENQKDAKVLAGGTDLLVGMTEKRLKTSNLVALEKIQELNKIQEENDCIIIGANATVRKVEMSSTVLKIFPVLSESCSQLGSVQIRNRATVVGNVCNSSPSADTPPALLTLGAKLAIATKDGTKLVVLEDFFQGPGENILKRDEIVTDIIIPVNQGAKCGHSVTGSFLKFGFRKAMDIAIVNVAVNLEIDKRYICRKARIALGAVAPVPFRAKNAERILEGKKIETAVIEKAVLETSLSARPITDFRAKAEYRLKLIEVLTRRAIEKAVLKTKEKYSSEV